MPLLWLEKSSPYSERCQQLDPLRLFAVANDMGTVLGEEDQVKMKCLMTMMTGSKSSGKLTYATCLKFFDEGDGDRSYFIIEAFLANSLSRYMSNKPEQGLNQYIFPLAILIAKCMRFALTTMYLGFLYRGWNKCVRNITRPMGRYDIVMHANSSFYKCSFKRESPNHFP